MTAHQIHGLTRSISEMMYAHHGIIMTVGVYSNATGSISVDVVPDTAVSIIIDHNYSE